MIEAPIMNRNINLIRNYCELRGIDSLDQKDIEEHLAQIETGNPSGCKEELRALTEYLPNAISLVGVELGYKSVSLFLHRYQIEPFPSSTIVLAIYVGMARYIFGLSDPEANNV